MDLREHCQTEGLSRLLQWMDAVAARPSLVDTTPPKDDLVENVRSAPFDTKSHYFLNSSTYVLYTH
eukprot:1326984-Pyramimonas_sp.AAC.1